MFKFFLTFLVAVSAFAQAPNQTQATEIPKLVRLSDLKGEYLRIATERSTQRPSKVIASSRRLRLLWARALQQTREPLCSHWSVTYAVDRVKFLQSYDNVETSDGEYQELLDLTQQLDESGCCAFLPESNLYRIRN